MTRNAPPDRKGRTHNQKIEMAASRMAAERMLEIRSKFKDDEAYENAIQSELANSFRDGVAGWTQQRLDAYLDLQPEIAPRLAQWTPVMIDAISSNPEPDIPGFAHVYLDRRRKRGCGIVCGILEEGKSYLVLHDKTEPRSFCGSDDIGVYLRSELTIDAPMAAAIKVSSRWKLVTEMSTVVTDPDTGYPVSFDRPGWLGEYLQRNTKDGKVAGYPVESLFVVSNAPESPIKLVDFLRDLELHAEESGPGEEDGPWADGFAGRSGAKQCVITVSGPTMSGKTALVVAIRRFLQTLVKSLEVVDPDPHAVVFDQEAVNLREILRKIDVRIYEKQTNVRGKGSSEQTRVVDANPFESDGPFVLEQRGGGAFSMPTTDGAESGRVESVSVPDVRLQNRAHLRAYIRRYSTHVLDRTPGLVVRVSGSEKWATVEEWHADDEEKMQVLKAGRSDADCVVVGTKKEPSDYKVRSFKPKYAGKRTIPMPSLSDLDAIIERMQSYYVRGEKNADVWGNVQNGRADDLAQLGTITAALMLPECQTNPPRGKTGIVWIDNPPAPVPKPNSSPSLQRAVLLTTAAQKKHYFCSHKCAHESSVPTPYKETMVSVSEVPANFYCETCGADLGGAAPLVPEENPDDASYVQHELKAGRPKTDVPGESVQDVSAEPIRTGLHSVRKEAGGYYLVHDARHVSLDPTALYAVGLGGLFLFYRASDNGPAEIALEQFDWVGRDAMPIYNPEELARIPWNRVDGPWMLWRRTGAGLRPV